MLLLHADQTTLEWVDRTDYQKTASYLKPLPKNKSIATKSTKNSSVIDVSMNIFSDDFKTNSIENENQENVQNDEIPEPKTIYNHTIDGFNMIESRKGFLNANTITLHNKVSNEILPQIMGIYCVRWRRSGQLSENESKFLVKSIEIVEAPLSIHCYLDETMYVKVPMTLIISLRNTTNSTLHLKTGLKNADNFMFAGHSQVFKNLYQTIFI